MDIINPVLVLGGMGLLFGVLLSVASNVFAVEIDAKVEAIRAALPGANCGACGYPGCDGLANAIAEGDASVNSCPVGGAAVAEALGEIMGINPANLERQVAVVLCQGDCEKSKEKFIYQGMKDCLAASVLQGGSKMCSYGCLGCGTCDYVCEFDAIEIVDGLAIIDKDKCTACLKCIKACPKGIIELVPYEKEYIVKCKSKDVGKEVRNNCEVGCIGCKICVKNCPVEAIGFENNLAKIDYDKCINCGICAKKCPTKAIHPGLLSEEKV